MHKGTNPITNAQRVLEQFVKLVETLKKITVIIQLDKLIMAKIINCML